MCMQNKSSQQLILDLFKNVVQTDAKGLILLVFAYEQRERLDGNGRLLNLCTMSINTNILYYYEVIARAK